MESEELLVAAILTAAFAFYGRSSALEATDGSAGWMVTAGIINTFQLALAFGVFSVLVLVLS